MSATPRTDAERIIEYDGYNFIAVEFARKLELELAEARQTTEDAVCGVGITCPTCKKDVRWCKCQP
jgi:hypothetical protein